MSEAPTHGSSPGDGQRQHDAAEDGSGSFSNAPRSAVSPRAKARYLDRESLRLVVDGAPDAIFVQVDKRFAYLNPAAVRLFGARDASQLLGQPVIERFEPAHHDRIREGICLLNEERQVVPPLDQVYIRLDGQRIDVETSGAPVTFEGREGAIVFVRDIGFRLKAAEALRSSEERFRAVFERTNVAMAITDCEGRVLGCNLAFEQLLGYSLDELRHTQIPCLAAPEDAEALHALYKEVWMQWRHSGRLEARYFHKDGRTVWSEVSLSSICEACGQVSGVIVVLVDLSHRKAAEQARRRSDERLRRAMESIPDVVVVYDRDLRIQYINAATRKITGRPASDLLGKRDEELWPEAVFGTYLPVLREALATRQTRFIETEITIQPGNPRSLQITCVPVLDERGEVLEVLGITHDFTENKLAAQASRASEAKYRRLYETTMDGFASVDMDGHFLEFNETYATMLGYQPEELRALTFLDVTPRKWHAIETEIIQKQVIGRGYSDIYEKEYRRKDGEIIAVELRTVLLRNPDGTPAGMWGLARQITDRKRMEQALLASEQRYRSFVEASAQVVWRTHPDGRVDWELPSWQAFSGQTPEQARGFGWMNAIHPDDRARVAEAWREASEGHRLYEVEYLMRIHDGSYRNILARGVPVPEEDGSVREYIGTCIDITERKRAEIATRASAETYDTLLRTTQQGLMLLGPDGAILEVNDAYCHLIGYARDELLRMQIGLIDADRPREQIAANLAALKAKGRERFERRHRRRDGSVVDVEVCLTWLPVREAFVTFIQDISERKRDEETRVRLATAIEQAVEAVIITDPAGMIQYVNPAFETVTGYSRAEAIGKTPGFLKSGQHSEEFYRELWETISGGKPWAGRLVNRRKDGTLYEEEATISPVVDGSGKIINFVAGKRDVSRERTLEEQLRQAQKIEAIGQLAAGVAHDFNNLLTALIGYLDVARAVLPPGHAAGEALEGIAKVAEQASGITRSLRTFSGRSVASKEHLCLGTMIAETVKLLRHMLPKSVRLDVDARVDAPFWVNADRTQLQQVLINLAINARDAMPDGGVLSIAVGAAKKEHSGLTAQPSSPSEAQVVVRDTGVGMSPEILSKIFEPFFTTKSRARGTGLGLAIVHGIVKDHGGRIVVESEPGKGSTFHVVLPCVSAGSGPATAEATPANTRGRGETILLAEDDECVRGLLITELMQLGYTVIAAEDGDAALRCYQERRGALRLLVLDFDLPGRTGGDCLRLIRQGGDGVPALLISGALNIEPLARRLGAVLLPKPFGMAQFRDQVSRMLNGVSAGKSS